MTGIATLADVEALEANGLPADLPPAPTWECGQRFWSTARAPAQSLSKSASNEAMACSTVAPAEPEAPREIEPQGDFTAGCSICLSTFSAFVLVGSSSSERR